MAITFVNSSTVDQAAARELVIPIPSGSIAGDFMVAFVKQSANANAQIWDDDGGGGNGWTREAYNRTTSGRDQETAVYWKLHDGSEPTPTFTHGPTNYPMSGTILTYRGVDSSNPISELTYAEAPNDGNPPNPTVLTTYDNTAVVCFHAATHDDITAVAAPTGFTLRSQVWAGTSNDHRNHFTADIFGISAGSYTPPDWQHSVSNTTPEYHTYSLALNETQAIGINSVDDPLNWGNTNKVVTGFGFEAAQGAGKVEIWSDPIGTIKTTQTIDSWSDTSIQFDTVRGSLPDDTNLYIVVTNDNGDVSAPRIVAFGLIDYVSLIQSYFPDHLWTLDGNYNDTGSSNQTRNMTSGVVGSHSFVTNIAEGAAQAMKFSSVTDRREIADSPYMNATITSSERTMAAWVTLGGIQQSLGAIWKEGGGVQNLAFLVGIGNILMAQMADTPSSPGNVQAVSSIRLATGRPYHIVLRYSLLENPKEMRLFLDGEEQPLPLTDGNPMGAGVFNSHSGDVTWGDPDANLETGGTDVAYAGQEDCIYQHWCTWSDNSPETGALDKVTQIRDGLFRRGASPLHVIVSDTQANMQIALDLLQNTTISDWPLAIRVEGVVGGGDLTLTSNNMLFDSRITIHLEHRGLGTLTWVNGGTTDMDSSKSFSSKGGTIVVQNPSTLTLTGLIAGSILEIYDNEVVNLANDDTRLVFVGSSGTSFQYSHNGVSNDIVVKVLKVGYVEIRIPVTLNSTDQNQNIIYEVETND